MPAKKKTTAKKPAPASGLAATTRHIKSPKRKFYKRQDKRFRERPKLPSAFKLTRASYQLLRKHWKIIGGIMLIYGLLNILLVRGLTGGLNVSDLKNQADSAAKGAGGHLASGFTIFGMLLNSSNSTATSASSGTYQSLLLVVVSLVVVWSYRQLLAGNIIRVRDGFYQGMQPLIPVILVLMVFSIQLLPMVVGVWLYAALISSGITVNAIEQIVSLLIIVPLVSWSVYMVCSSVFALYIAALPGMTPIKALRSARELVRYRRWSLIRKLLFLPLVLLVIGCIIMFPFILFLPAIAQWIFFVLSTVALAAIHAYMYTLYRELINDR